MYNFNRQLCNRGHIYLLQGRKYHADDGFSLPKEYSSQFIHPGICKLIVTLFIILLGMVLNNSVHCHQYKNDTEKYF